VRADVSDGRSAQVIAVSEARDGAGWNDFVQGAADATIMHVWEWKAVMERAYGHDTFYLAARDERGIRGVLPLTLVKGGLLGKSLVSMPFMDYGGACTRGDAEAERALVDRARELARARGAKLVLRYLRQPALDLPCSLEKVTMLLELGSSEEALWKRLPSERRNRVKKGQREGVTASIHGADGLAEFYEVFAVNMRDLGSPVHSVRFFSEVLAQLGERARVILVRCDGRAIGAGLMLIYDGMVSIPWVSSLRQFFDKCPNQILYWEAMRYGIASGHRVLDFGRSSRDSGTFEAKRQWRAEPVQLYWHYDPADVGAPGEDVKSFGWMVNVWRRLPVPVANVVGPWLRRSIAN
jgi:serine/alanine adding enzyme